MRTISFRGFYSGHESSGFPKKAKTNLRKNFKNFKVSVNRSLNFLWHNPPGEYLKIGPEFWNTDQNFEKANIVKCKSPDSFGHLLALTPGIAVCDRFVSLKSSRNSTGMHTLRPSVLHYLLILGHVHNLHWQVFGFFDHLLLLTYLPTLTFSTL